MTSHQDQATSETAPLLADPRPTDQSSRILLSKGGLGLSPEILVIPVIIATRLATQAPSTTLVELVRQAVCKYWNASQGDPATIPAGCDAPEIEHYFATAVATLIAVGGILVLVACGIISRISSLYGRKPAFLLVLVVGITGNCLVSVSGHVPGWLANWVFLAGILLVMFSDTSSYAYLGSMYIVDVCAPKDRTPALSRVTGWGALGTCISFFLGGNITTKTGNPLIVYYMATAIFVATFIYVVSFLPESFPEGKRSALLRTSPELSARGTSARPLLIFEPLKLLMPIHKLDGTRNWRITWCAVHMMVFSVADLYASTAWVVLVTSKYNLTPADTGLFLTIITISGTVVLALIVPSLVRFLRPYYSQKIIRPLPAVEDMSSGEESEMEKLDRLDVHLAFVSCIVAGVFYLSAAASTTTPTLILSGIGIGFVSMHIPTIRSLVAGSVDPLKQGEALAAIEMVSSAGNTLSPIVMGSILGATINTAPLLMFYVHLIVVLISSVLLLLVRDADRYRKPHGA